MHLRLIGGPRAAGWSGAGDYDPENDPPLKPCPFCRETVLLTCSNTHTPFYQVCCDSCGAEGPTSTVGHEWNKRMSRKAVVDLHERAFAQAIELWNTRP